MENNVFTAVKEQLNLKDVAEYYGVDVNRGGFASCLFHDERTPSMKLYDDHYHCFGCGCHGDVTDLTARLFNLSPIESAQKLAADFGVFYDSKEHSKMPKIHTKLEYYSYASQEQRAYRFLVDYCDFLDKCRRDYAPTQFVDELHPLFVQAITDFSKFEYYRDIFITGSKDERVVFLKDFSGVLGEIEQGFNKAKTACQATELA